MEEGEEHQIVDLIHHIDLVVVVDLDPSLVGIPVVAVVVEEDRKESWKDLT